MVVLYKILHSLVINCIITFALNWLVPVVPNSIKHATNSRGNILLSSILNTQHMVTLKSEVHTLCN